MTYLLRLHLFDVVETALPLKVSFLGGNWENSCEKGSESYFREGLLPCRGIDDCAPLPPPTPHLLSLGGSHGQKWRGYWRDKVREDDSWYVSSFHMIRTGIFVNMPSFVCFHLFLTGGKGVVIYTSLESL